MTINITYHPTFRIEACGRKNSGSRNAHHQKHGLPVGGTKVHIAMTSAFAVSLY